MYMYRPMVVLSGSSDQPQESMGAFQEFPQVYSRISSSNRKSCLILFYRLKPLDSFQNMLLVFHHLIEFHFLSKK